jgi:hypothetical protein
LSVLTENSAFARRANLPQSLRKTDTRRPIYRRAVPRLEFGGVLASRFEMPATRRVPPHEGSG